MKIIVCVVTVVIQLAFTAAGFLILLLLAVFGGRRNS
jgi:hypothetical protein